MSLNQVTLIITEEVIFLVYQWLATFNFVRLSSSYSDYLVIRISFVFTISCINFIQFQNIDKHVDVQKSLHLVNYIQQMY